MKSKIHLVTGCTTFLEKKEVVSKRMPELNVRMPEPNDNYTKPAAQRGGDAGALLEGFLVAIIKAVDASAGIVRVLSPEGRQLRLIASSGMQAEACRNVSVADAWCGACGQSLATNDIEASDADFCMSRYGAAYFAEACKFVLAIPLVGGGKEGELSGVVTLFFASAQNLTEGLERTLKSYAELMHIALNNVWQNEDRYQISLLAERQSIANEIHDSLAQTLYFAKIRASLLHDALKTENDILAFKCAQDIDEALESSQKTVRELVTHFRCQMDPDGLQCALRKLVKDFIVRNSIALEYNNQVEKFDLPAEYELQIFLIVREALVNIVTHSGASIARLNVACIGGQYRFTVEDNGGGIGSGTPPEGHYGLVIMRERALRIGGTVEVESLEGLGTRVQLIFSAPVVTPNVA